MRALRIHAEAAEEAVEAAAWYEKGRSGVGVEFESSAGTVRATPGRCCLIMLSGETRDRSVVLECIHTITKAHHVPIRHDIHPPGSGREGAS